MSQSRFDKAATTWDEFPPRVALAYAIGEAIRAQVPITDAMTALDFGCGTGLLTFGLQPYVRRVIGIDTSPGMLAVLNEKAAALGLTNVETRQLDLTSEPLPAMRVDLIVSAMALHHVADVPHLLQVFAQLLMPGGYLALADLVTENGSFHEDHTGVHHFGFDPAWFTVHLPRCGFQQVQATTAHVMERATAEGVRRYPIFLISGRRGADGASA